MKRFLPLMLLGILGTTVCLAQFTRVTHLTGSATYGSHTVGVTSAGTASSISYCDADPYWIGAFTTSTPDPGSYTFTFSPAVNALRITINAANTGESITMAVNGTRYSLTAANLFTWTVSCGEPPMALSGDSILAPAGGSGHAIGVNIYECGITSVTVATNGLLNGSVFNMTFSDTPICSKPTNDGPVCLFDTINFSTALLGPGSYVWSGPNGFTSTLPNPYRAPVTYGDTGTYRVIKDGTDTFYTRFGTLPYPDPSASYLPPACFGGSLSLVASSPLTAVNYLWIGPGSFSSTVQSPVITDITLGQRGKYIVRAESGTCVGYDTVSVDVVKLPQTIVTNTSPACERDRLNFTASNTVATRYRWMGPNGYVSTVQNPTIGSISTLNAGTYTVTASAQGCSIDATTVVSIAPKPNISLRYIYSQPHTVIDDTVILPRYGETLQLEAQGAWVYTWQPHDGSVSDPNINNPRVTPLAPTNYIVYGMTEYGCRDTANIYVRFAPDQNIVIPSAFSPNGDGKNDVFRIPAGGLYRLVDFSVYDRWGNQVFNNNTDINKGWDGYYKAAPADLGVYYYIIILSQPNGELITKKGDVTLIR